MSLAHVFSIVPPTLADEEIIAATPVIDAARPGAAVSTARRQTATPMIGPRRAPAVFSAVPRLRKAAHDLGNAPPGEPPCDRANMMTDRR